MSGTIHYIEQIDLANLSKFDIHMLELVSPPNALSRNARLVRFLYEFKPYRTVSKYGILKISKSGEFTIPATFLSEAARHISPGIGRTNKGRYSELMEYYGPLSKTELEELAKKTGFKPNIESVFIPTNHANRLEEDMKLFDKLGNTIHQADRLPTHQFSILRKI